MFIAVLCYQYIYFFINSLYGQRIQVVNLYFFDKLHFEVLKMDSRGFFFFFVNWVIIALRHIYTQMFIVSDENNNQ